jgi:hypothetical protein
MATSRRPSLFGLEPLSLGPELMPPRTPGCLGMRDAGDPNSAALLGDTPGSLGIRDGGDATAGRLVPPLLPLDFEECAGYAGFRQQALDQQIVYAKAMGREFNAAVADDELAVVEAGQRMRKPAAAKCREMLAKARADLDNAKADAKKAETEKAAGTKAGETTPSAGGKTASDTDGVPVSEVKGFGVSSGYRDFKRDERLWNSAFPRYYKETYYDRYFRRGGPHGRDAVKLQALYDGDRKAAPGFSNHSNGLAVDFWAREGNEMLVAKTGKKKKDLARINARWKQSWLHRWLVKQAATYGFYPIKTEAWHWEYHGVKDAAKDADRK